MLKLTSGKNSHSECNFCQIIGDPIISKDVRRGKWVFLIFGIFLWSFMIKTTAG